ncbi:MAG: sarcosine oxidase subunit gamma family protein, partial [Pseudomonadota bacterium]
MDDPRSALGGAATQNTYIGIRDRGPQGQVTVKADLADDRVVQAVLDTTGLALPERLKVVCGETGNRAVWMAPDEVLLLSDRYEDGAAWAEHLANSTSGDTFAIDVSDARSVLALSGAHVAEVLAKGAPCDLG